MRLACVIATLFLCMPSPPAQTKQDTKTPERKTIGEVLGRTAKEVPGGVVKFSMPRKDMKVAVDGIEVKPGLALGSWAAFREIGGHQEAMGDLVLAENEVAPVMKRLIDAGFEITALHNHLLMESPHVMYMHFHGMGDATRLASGLHDALAETGTPPQGAPAAAPSLDLRTEQIDSLIGHKGTNNGGIYQISVPRSETIKEDGVTLPNSMGLETVINFQPIGGGNAATTGDFVLLADEVNPVIRALRQHGIAVAAIHSHMLTEQPRLFFMHFWGKADAMELARGLRAALDQTKSGR
jgi:hypothetical protein